MFELEYLHFWLKLATHPNIPCLAWEPYLLTPPKKEHSLLANFMGQTIVIIKNAIAL